MLAIATYLFDGEAYVTSLLGKFRAYAIFALSIDLIWGFAGILSLGQAVYFGIGAHRRRCHEDQLHARASDPGTGGWDSALYGMGTA